MNFALIVPGITGIVAGSVSIYGAVKFHYYIAIFACISSCLEMLLGFSLFQYEYGYGWATFVACHIPPFVRYSFIFSFSIVFTRKIAFVQAHG